MFAALIPLLGGLLDKLLPDPAQQAQAKLALLQMAQNGELAKLSSAASVITAEANSKFELAAVWRPLTMLSFALIVFNNQFICPYLSAIFGWHVNTPLPPEMWDLLKIGIGGYIVGRSAEKVVTTWKGASPPQVPGANAQGVPPVNMNGA